MRCALCKKLRKMCVLLLLVFFFHILHYYSLLSLFLSRSQIYNAFCYVVVVDFRAAFSNIIINMLSWVYMMLYHHYIHIYMEFFSLYINNNNKDDDEDEFSLLKFYSSSFSIHMRVLVYDCDCALLLKYRILEMFNLSLSCFNGSSIIAT